MHVRSVLGLAGLSAILYLGNLTAVGAAVRPEAAGVDQPALAGSSALVVA